MFLVRKFIFTTPESKTPKWEKLGQKDKNKQRNEGSQNRRLENSEGKT